MRREHGGSVLEAGQALRRDSLGGQGSHRRRGRAPGDAMTAELIDLLLAQAKLPATESDKRALARLRWLSTVESLYAVPMDRWVAPFSNGEPL
ncbi:hypothetical protein [Amycolatopsis sp. lyj-90]|uniref:hypothetical protein n=1 Tax=Amycolatopsis sp. lyj-90 TaxID=2789285 RepID=UPI003978B7D9